MFAGPAATFFGIPQAVASFKFAALVPLVRSFGHLGIKQIQRDYGYRAEALAVTASSVTGLAVAAFAAATILPDHRVIILAFLVEMAVYVAASHILAQAPMRVIPDRQTLRQLLAWGLPLMLNGAGLALIMQADRMVVGRFFGMDILGVYAVVLGLAVAPTSVLSQIANGLGLSMLARSRETPKRHLETYLWLAWFFAFLAFGYAAFIGLTLDVLVPLVFGKTFAVGTDAVIMTSVLAGVLFGDGLTTALFQRAVIARIPNGIGSLWRCLAVATAGVAILTTTLRLLPDPSWANRGIVAASGALPAAILGWGVLWRWHLRERT